MSGLPILPLFVREYLVDTQHLTPEESGAYLHLMMQAWVTSDCSLPNDDAQLARLARVSPERWPEIRSTVLAFWTVKRGRLIQRRLLEEFRKTNEKSERRRRAGQKGGRASHSKQREKEPSNASANVEHCSTNHNHNHNHTDSSPSGRNPDGGGVVARAREALPTANDLAAKLFEAGGRGLARNSISLEMMTEPYRWLENGLDLENDILPVIRVEAKAAAERGDQIKSWRYFTAAVLRHAQDRRRPLPTIVDGQQAEAGAPPRRGDPYASRVDMDAVKRWAREEDERVKKLEAGDEH